jgi:lincosamide nucleotidyltransferase A/C/D/E
MTAADVIEILDLLEAGGIRVWLNGGWGVDALLGRQTREHDDLDITISAIDRNACGDVMRSFGFTMFRIDSEFNWVMVDPHDRLVDVHIVDFSNTRPGDRGPTLYGWGGLPFEVGSLNGVGEIAGRKVNCETADAQVRGHTTYPPDEFDEQDVVALCQKFAIDVPPLFEHKGSE